MEFRHRFPLQPHGRKRIEIRRNAHWTDVGIFLDGTELGRTDAEGIAKGLEIRLWDQSLLRVWMERGPRDTPFLYLTRNGHPLTGSAGDPEKILYNTLWLIWVFAAVQIVLGGMVALNDRADPVANWMLALGLLMAVFSLFAAKRSVPAMTAACAILFCELAALLFAQARLTIGSALSIGTGLWLTGWLLLRGIRAARELKAIALPIRHPPEPLKRDGHHKSEA